MCEATFLRYADAINDVLDSNTDLEPGPLLYSGVDCTQSQYPTNSGIDFVSNTLTSGSVIQRNVTAGWNFVATSLFFPFNFREVKLENEAKSQSSTLIGPFFISDLSTVRWQSDPSASATLLSDPVTYITFVTVMNWTQQALVPMCMGKREFIGPYPLSRYYPQTNRCDEFMANVWCPSALSNPECACFQDQPGVISKGESLGVVLPVLCFGEDCATRDSYKTQQMLDAPCNITVCQQTINSTPGIVNEGEDVIFCGGRFYNQEGSVAAPSISPIDQSTQVPEAAAPFYVWIMLGVSGILFLVLVYLLFGRPPKNDGSSILKQLKKIRAKQKATGQIPTAGTNFDF